MGHLTSDGDEGEDKLEKGAEREGKSVYEIADFYSNIYLDNYAKMEFLPADVLARATDYIEADMRAVDEMTAHGYTYETTDGVYFDTSKFPEYADFARLDLEGLQAGARVGYNFSATGFEPVGVSPDIIAILFVIRLKTIANIIVDELDFSINVECLEIVAHRILPTILWVHKSIPFKNFLNSLYNA